MNKINVVIALVMMILAMIAQVNSQCMKLVPAFHECMYPNADHTDEYFKEKLQGVSSFEDAMALFRSYYQTVLGTCSSAPSTTCDCFLEKMANEPEYGVFFTNVSHFNDMKRLTAIVKYGYPLRSINEINRDPLVHQIFLLSTPSLDEFCHKFDYSYHMDVFYNDLKACKTSGQTFALAVCVPSSIFSSDSQENFIKCLHSYRRCAPELKNFIALGDVARYPFMVRGDLYSYIEYLTSPSHSNRFSSHLISSLLAFTLFMVY